jgi:hypothetical protein
LTCLLAGLVLYRNGSSAKKPVTIREAFDMVNTDAVPLATCPLQWRSWRHSYLSWFPRASSSERSYSASI